MSIENPRRQFTLAVVASSFNVPSETFIRNHVRTLAPGETVLACRDATGSDAFGCPTLADIDPWSPPQTFRARLVNAFQHRWRLYVDSALPRKTRWKLISFLKQHGVAAILAEYGPIGCLLTGVSRDAKVPLYVHFHGYDASVLLQQRLQVWHYKRLFADAEGIIVPSRFLASKLLEVGCPEDKLHVSPYGVNHHRFTPTSRMPGRIIAVGRLVEKKAPHITIKAFGRIARQFPDARLDMIGDGPLQERCVEMVADLGLSGRVVLHGVQDNDSVAVLMQKASLFVQHSMTSVDGDIEGMPVAILEAMASALPVISTCHSGIPEAVEEGVTGYLVAEGDVEGMANAMAALLSDPSRAASMGDAGRARVLERFTSNHARDRLRQIMGLPSLKVKDTYGA